MEIEIVKKRFGTVKQKTVHELIELEDGIHFKCPHLHCPGNNNGICRSRLIGNQAITYTCFCG